MESKNNKRKKKTNNNTKTKVPKNEPEIFVLPPNILQKLGIQIQQVQNNTSEKPTMETNVLEKNKLNNALSKTAVTKKSVPEDGDSNKDQSLMETAILMKNSVFLSPTFAPNTSNSIPGELELLARDNEIMSSVTSHELDNAMVIASPIKLQRTGHIKNNVQDNVSPIPNSLTNDTISCIDPISKLMSSNITVEVPATEVPEELEAIEADDHLDEAYLSDCSNSNPEPIESTRNDKKINIISEKILSPLGFVNKNSGMSNCLSHVGPVSEDTLLSSKSSGAHLSAAIRDNFVYLSVNSKITLGNCNKSKILEKNSDQTNIVSRKDETENVFEPEVNNECLSECIDISVTDIEKHLENEEILQEFANEIICNDSSDIINKIEKSECSEETFDSNITHLTNTNNILSDSQNIKNDSLNNSNEECFFNYNDNNTTCKKELEFVNCGNYNSVIQLNVPDNKGENLIGVVSPKNVKNKASMPISDLSKSITSDADKHNSVKQNSDKEIGNHQDKVEEITKYLKQCLNRKQKSLSRANNSKRTPYSQKLGHKNLKINQGVEKPGGNEAHHQGSTCPKPVKTYGKATKRNVPTTNFSVNTPISKNNKPQETNSLQPIEPSSITVSDSTLYENFCLCGDFGRMAFYDCDSPYKHIHFWEQRDFNIAPDLMRSIYSDHYITPDPTDSVYDLENDHENDIPELANYNICWNAIEYKSDSSKVKECMNNNLEQLQQINTSYPTCASTSSVTQKVDQLSEIRSEESGKEPLANKQSCIKREDVSISHLSNETTKSYVSLMDENVTEVNKSATEQSEVEIFIPIMIDDCSSAEYKTNEETIQIAAAIDDEMNNTNQLENTAEFKANEEIIQNAATNDEMNIDNTNQLEVSVQESLLAEQITDEDEMHNNDIPHEEIEDGHSSTENTKDSHEPTQSPHTNIFDRDNDCDQESSLLIERDPGKASVNKKKKQKKSIEPIRKSRRVTLENHNIEHNPEHSTISGKKTSKKRRKSQMQTEMQTDSDDEEPLSVQKARKVQSLDKRKSLAPPNVAENNVNEKNDVQCGVCSQVVKASDWFEHIGKEHSYVAWRMGEPPVNVDDKEQFETHLKEILKQTAGLVCSKCGLIRKYVKIYLKHFNQCEAIANVNLLTVKTENETLDNVDEHVDDNVHYYVDGDTFICGVCNDEVDPKQWASHNMKKHYNLAWIRGKPPVDVNTPPFAVEKLLREYKDKTKKLVCKACGASRVSYMGFYAHILTCGKTEEEIDKFKIGCDLCDKRYLFLYKSQHMIAHRDQELAKERRKLAQVKRENEAREQLTPETPTNRRRAAEKARTVIEKINESTTGTYKCDKCSFATDTQEELTQHRCESSAETDEEPFAVSGSDEDDSYDEVDSNLSAEEEEKFSAKKIKKEKVSVFTAKPKPLPFVSAKPKQYIFKSGEEHYEAYFSSEELFPEWRNKGLEEVSEQEMSLYMPPLKESCKVKISTEKDGDWKTFKQFEAAKINGASTVFVGASIHCAAWASPLGTARAPAPAPGEAALLAVAAHRGPDAPRLPATETFSHPALIQIWDFGNFKSLPKFAFGIAHDHGTVWAMDWCPSGARDHPDHESPRLGLLATACSDGVVYIYSVPYPSASKDSNKCLYKLKPVVELRLTSASNRQVYQASAVKWCNQIGHGLIFVGYSDGTTAHYDLNTESPFLRSTDNNVTVLNPYYDERSHSTCVTGVSTFPCGGRAGATLSGATTGVRVTSSPAARPRRRAAHHAALSVGFEPLFPQALFASDAAKTIASPPELDWFGSGLQMGSMTALAACAWCGLCLAYAAPHLRSLRPHPAYTENKKQIIGTVDMISLSNKRKKPLKADNLVTIVEPTTYEEAIKKYGVELKLDKSVRPPVNNRHRDIRPDLFPLGNPATMAFCPAPAHHDRVAIATHAGIIFVFSVSG